MSVTSKMAAATISATTRPEVSTVLAGVQHFWNSSTMEQRIFV
jgi:hypothetical protein